MKRAAITIWTDRWKRHAFTGVAIFLAFVFLTGGGSREDIASLWILRSVAALAVAWSVMVIKRDEVGRIIMPLSLLGALAAMALVQLVPLPPEAWQALGEREMIERADTLVGMAPWRPISLAPSATVNFLASLIVPLAALLLYAQVRHPDRVLYAFVAIGVASAFIGIMQLFADPRSGLFLYEITSRGHPVGLFANRNHQAVFLSACVLISLYLAQNAREPGQSGARWALTGSALFLGSAVITNASRAGLTALLAVVVLSTGFLIAERVSLKQSGPKRFVVPAALASVGVGILAMFAAANRSPSLSRILENTVLEDLRAKLLPLLDDMVLDFLPWGTGMGAFEHAYRMREPVELLFPAYVNEAHNDWLQFPIEGGVAALLIMAGVTAFAAWRAAQLLARPARGNPASRESWLGLGLLAVLAMASIVDYPLRVPSIMALAIIALAMFAGPAVRSVRSETTFQLTQQRGNEKPGAKPEPIG
ncbi:O-antigen ligase family protein [Qipengyuania sp. CAU 1752]